MARAAIPEMKDGGAIVMNGSVTGLLGSSKLLDYSMTKGGIHAFTQLTRNEPGGQGHSRERHRAWSRLDAAEPRRPAGREGEGVRS